MHLKQPTRRLTETNHFREYHASYLATLHTALFGLAPDGVFPAIFVTENAVSSYLTISPLLALFKIKQAVYFLWHFPARYRVWPLASILFYGARTFLQRANSSNHPARFRDKCNKPRAFMQLYAALKLYSPIGHRQPWPLGP